MKTADFDFELPEELIAQDPVTPRDHCRLMVIDRDKGTINNAFFYNIVDYLKQGDVLVFNDSKVIPARILFEFKQKSCELLLLRKIEDGVWKAIGKPGKLLKEGFSIIINEHLTAQIISKDQRGEMIVAFKSDIKDVDKLLLDLGKAPFPPYIKRSKASMNDYQPIYAKNEGSVASPTAGLHFTKELLEKLKLKGVELEYVTLHVGLGTFNPIKTDHIEDHYMHNEVFYLNDETAKRLTMAKGAGKRIIAVGTTSVRVLESCFCEADQAFKSGYGETNIFIYPGYKWKSVMAMITNFHIPKSSLLLLVSSFGGIDLIKTSYQHAIKDKYRFYSFGDAMLIY